MATKTDICNFALVRIGVQQQLTNVDTDTSQEAVTLALIFASERDFVLRDFEWKSARAYAQPTLATNFSNPANTDWTYAYRMPADALYVRRILTANGRMEINPPPFDIGRDPAFDQAAAWSNATAYVSGNLVTLNGVTYECILGNTNQSPPNATYWRVVPNASLIFTDTANATIEYTAQLTNTLDFEPVFILMLAWRLASIIALGLSRMPELAAACDQAYEKAKQEAGNRSALEGQKDLPVDLTDTAAAEIVNLALLRIGVTKDLDPKSSPAYLVQARLAKISFIRNRDFVLRDFPWSWATSYADPQLFAGANGTPFNRDYVFAFVCPTDAVTIRRIVNPLEPRGFRRHRRFQFSGPGMWPTSFRVVAGAYGTIAIGPNVPANNDTLTINATTYTWKTVLTGAAREILIGPDLSTSALHLYEAINAGPNIGVDYGTGTVPSSDVTALQSGPQVTITGLSGTSVSWSKSSSNMTLYPTTALKTGRLILSSEPCITIEYTRQPASASEFDLYDKIFASMLAWKIAADLAPSRIPDPKIQEARRLACQQAYLLEKSEAQATEISESQDDLPDEAESIRSRG